MCVFLWVCGDYKSLTGAALSALPRTLWETIVEALARLWPPGSFKVCTFLFALPLHKSGMIHFCLLQFNSNPFFFPTSESVVSKFPCVVRNHPSKAFALLLSSVSQFFTKRNFKMDGRRPRWGGECFSCSITSCVRPSTTNIRSEFMTGLHTGMYCIVSWMWFDGSVFAHLQDEDSLPAQTFGR